MKTVRLTMAQAVVRYLANQRSVRDGKVTAFIPDPETNPDASATSGAEGVAADARGNIFGAEVGPKMIKKYVKQ